MHTCVCVCVCVCGVVFSVVCFVLFSVGMFFVELGVFRQCVSSLDYI